MSGETGALARAAESSTGPLEVAVVLESQGINDRVASERYGAPDVFALAEVAYARSGGAVGMPSRQAAMAGGDPCPGRSRWFALRGFLYAVPAVVALTLLPAGDPVESALLLGGLVLSWAWGYGMTFVAWAYIGNLDVPAAHRFLRRSVLVGLLVATVVAVVAVYASLVLTVTMQVTLWTLLLLVGQSAYLFAAATLLMTGNELRLLIALAPAVVGSILAVSTGEAGPMVGPGTGPAAYGSGHPWLGASVILAVVLALTSTRDGARPAQPLPRSTMFTALMHAGYGLMIALLVLYPAFNELLNDNFEALPLSVTLAALPLVLSMGIAESLLYAHRADVRRLLASTGSTSEFARDVRRAVWRAHLRFIGALATMTALLGGVAVAVFGMTDPRFVLLGLDYAVLGAAVFAAMVLTVIGRIAVVLTTLGTGTAVLIGFTLQADHLVDDATALTWHGAVGLALLILHGALVQRCTARTVSHR